MTDTLIWPSTVTHADVDRQELMLLPRLFKLLQEVAIAHADQFGAGAAAAAETGETWVLNRIAVSIERYPRVGEALRVETWSTGIRGFKGYRDFRVHGADGNVLLRGSSVWLYVSTRRMAIMRVPRELAAAFPVGRGEPAFPRLEDLELAAPAGGAITETVTLRYSDFDGNDHVNNAAYLDLVQTALARAQGRPHPNRLLLHFARAIPLGTPAITVRIETDHERSLFSVESPGVVHMTGEATMEAASSAAGLANG